MSDPAKSSARRFREIGREGELGRRRGGEDAGLILCIRSFYILALAILSNQTEVQTVPISLWIEKRAWVRPRLEQVLGRIGRGLGLGRILKIVAAFPPGGRTAAPAAFPRSHFSGRRSYRRFSLYTVSATSLRHHLVARPSSPSTGAAAHGDSPRRRSHCRTLRYTFFYPRCHILFGELRPPPSGRLLLRQVPTSRSGFVPNPPCHPRR